MKQDIQKAFAAIKADQALVDRTRHRLLFGTAWPVAVQRQFFWRAAAVATVAVLLISIVLLSGLALSRTAVAAVSVDINPSIELDINVFNRVMAAEGFNEEGIVLLEGLDLQNKPVRQAVEAIVAAAARSGWLASDGSSIIAVTTSTDLTALKNKLEKQTRAAVQQALDESDSQAVIYQEHTTLARVREARQLNITPGRLNLIQRLTELAPETQADDYLTARISDIMQEIIALQKQQREQTSEAAEADRASKKEAKESVRESRASAKDQATVSTTATPTEEADPDLENPAGPAEDALASAYQKMEDALNQSQENRSSGNGKANRP